MSSVCSLTVAAAVLLHSMLGGFLHHEQGGVSTALGSLEATITGGDAGLCQGIPAMPHAPPRDGSHGCEAETCSFLANPASSVAVRPDDLIHSGDALWLPPAGGCCRPFHAIALCGKEEAPLPQARRLQARLCVWLN